MSKRLFTNSLIFFLGTMVYSVFNYLYNSRMGAILGPADYSIIGSLLAFISIVTIPTNAIATVAMRFTAHHHAKEQDGTIKTFFYRFTRRLGILGLVAVIIVLLLSPWLQGFLHLPSVVPVMLTAPVIFFAIMLPLNRGIMQGLQNFGQAVLNQNIDPFLKLTLGLLLVQLGLGIDGALGAIVIGSMVAYLVSFWPLQPLLKQQATPIKTIPAEVKEFSIVALIAFLMATLLMNIDILLVKHFLPAHEAGLYAALSTIGKIILFVTTPVVSVMFPMISDLQGREQKHYKVLLQSIILVMLISLCGVVGYFVLPELVVRLLYGPEFLEIAPLLGLFAIVMTLFSLINLWINYFLSIGNRFFIVLLGLSVVVEIILLLTRHASFFMVVEDLLVAMIVGFVALTGYYLYLKRSQLTQVISGGGFASLS